MESSHRYTALVTGFGPFDDHKINASWEAVKELEKLWQDSQDLQDVKLVTEEIAVSYERVSGRVAKLWKNHNPTIMVHVGVARNGECLTIESQAHSTGYQRKDICGRQPDEVNITPCVLQPEMDIKKICEAVNANSKNTGCKADISHDAGRYLCEYTFYQSLCIKPSCVLFVHVPDFHKYNSVQTAHGLLDILCAAIKDLRH